MGGGGLYKEGTVVTLDKAPEVWNGYKFVGWQIDGSWTNENPLTLRMDKAYDAVARYTKNDAAKIVIDSVPRIAEVTVNDKIYLPSELPVTLTYPIGTTLRITAENNISESPNLRYIFDMWKDQEKTSSRSVTVDQDTEFTTLYKTQYLLKTITEYGTASGNGWWDKDTAAEFKVDNEVVIDKQNDMIRYVFDGWDQGDYKTSPSNFIDIQEPTTVKANWRQENRLDLLSTVKGVSLYGGGWHSNGKTVALIAEEQFETPNSDTKYVFDRWVSVGPNTIIIANPQSPVTTITMDEPYVIEAKYKKSFLVNVWTPYGSATGNGFYDEGKVAQISILNPEIEVDPNQERKVFSGWNTGDARVLKLEEGQDLNAGQNLMLFVDKPVNVTASWKTQYYVDLVSSQGQTAGSGWYNFGSMAPISVKQPGIPPGAWLTYAFAGWSGDFEGNLPSARIIVKSPLRIAAEWRDDYTPAIFNSMTLAGVGAIGFVIFNKTRKRPALEKILNPLIKKSGRGASLMAAGIEIFNKTRKRLTSQNSDNAKYNYSYFMPNSYIKNSKDRPAGIA